jgi:hypothetical protein
VGIPAPWDTLVSHRILREISVTAIHKFWGLSGADRRLVCAAWVSLVRARIAVSAVSLPRLRRKPHLAARAGADPVRIGWAVCVASRFVPRPTCLVRALAAHRLLAAHGHDSDLRIGVAKAGAAGFAAHAWVECGGAVLVGQTDAEYSVLVEWRAGG